MVLKYKNGNVWGYIDNIRQSAVEDLDQDVEVRKYDKLLSEMPCEKDYKDPAEYMNGIRLSDEVIISNKVFSSATYDLDIKNGNNTHCENLVEPSMMNFPIVRILLYLEDTKEYDVIILITNQKAFLMNDKGQTIDRLS